MRLSPFPRRHRALWIIVAVLGISAWGSWLVSTGRTPGYSSGYAHVPISQSAAPSVSRAPGVPDVAEVLMTSRSAAPVPATGAIGSPSRAAAGSARATSTSVTPEAAAASGVAVSSPDRLAGMTDPADFARAVAHTVLTFAPGTDLDARANSVMAVAALPPIGSPAELAADLRRFDPDPVTRHGAGTVTFVADSIVPSPWATSRLQRLGLPEGSFAIDVAGNQLVTLPCHAPINVSVTLGITGACPPALVQCEIDRIFPRTVAQELGS